MIAYGRASLWALTVALHGGPVLAGFAGHGLSVLPVFAALLLLYTAAARKPDLGTGAGWAGLALMALIEAVLVGLGYGAGAGLALLLGGAVVPLWAPLALTAVATAAGVWAFRDAAEMDVMLESTLRALAAETGAAPLPASGDTPSWPAANNGARAAVTSLGQRLATLDAVTAEAIDPLVAGLDEGFGLAAFDPLYDASEADPVLAFALLRFVARPGVRAGLVARGEAGLAPMRCLGAASPVLRAEARARLGELITAGLPPAQRPAPEGLDALALRFPGEGFEGLADRLRAVEETR